MTCSFCGSRNNEEDRCRKCGRRPGDTLNGDFTMVRTEGALAAKIQPAARAAAVDSSQARRPIVRAVQQPLFPDRQSNVIQFAEYAPLMPTLRKTTANRAASKTPARPRTANRRRSAPEGQFLLDFMPPQPATPRTLTTTVEAVVSCDSPVATTVHRAVAAALDWTMALIGYTLFLAAFFAIGGEFTWNRINLLVFAGALVLVGFTYGLTWALLGVDSAGMRWTGLRLTTFDGFPLERKQRVLRFAGSCLSLCTVVGQLWCLADEESLTWQDHISGTFPTPRRVQAQVFRRA
ncbi:MAG: RDD family protein [Bryobacteraceae bacterium]|jgi:hypothetical protein